MSKTKLTDEQLFEVWRKGWDSAVSVAEQAMKEMMSQWRERFETNTVEIPKETFELMRQKVEDGLWKNMRIAQRGGLDYYFAATDPRSLAESRANIEPKSKLAQ